MVRKVGVKTPPKVPNFLSVVVGGFKFQSYNSVTEVTKFQGIETNLCLGILLSRTTFK